MWEKPHHSESAGFYASSADCSHQPYAMELHFASVLPWAELGFRRWRTYSRCFASLDAEFLVELPLDGGTAQEVRLWDCYWTLESGWKIPRSGEKGSRHPGIAGRTRWSKARSAQSPPQHGHIQRCFGTGLKDKHQAWRRETETAAAVDK